MSLTNECKPLAQFPFKWRQLFSVRSSFHHIQIFNLFSSMFCFYFSHFAAMCFAININSCIFCNAKFDCVAHVSLNPLRMLSTSMKITLKWSTFQKLHYKHNHNQFNMNRTMGTYSMWVKNTRKNIKESAGKKRYHSLHENKKSRKSSLFPLSFDKAFNKLV